MSPRRIGAAVLAVGLLATACGGDDRQGGTDNAPRTSTSASRATTSTSTPPSTQIRPTVIEVELASGQVVGGPRTENVTLGARVTIRARSDVAEELHVHTYDLSAEVRPGIPSELTFTADIPGRFEVEFESAGKHVLTLQVR